MEASSDQLLRNLKSIDSSTTDTCVMKKRRLEIDVATENVDARKLRISEDTFPRQNISMIETIPDSFSTDQEKSLYALFEDSKHLQNQYDYNISVSSNLCGSPSSLASDNHSNYNQINSSLDSMMHLTNVDSPLIGPGMHRSPCFAGNVLSPSVGHVMSMSPTQIKPNRTAWKSDEDEKLRAAVQKYHAKSWKKIAEEVGTKSEMQCCQRWEILKPGVVKGQWTIEEDRVLICLMTHGFANWGQLAYHIPGRTAKQCRERWFYHLDPSISKEPFTSEEDEKIITMYGAIGSKWAEIARALPGRSASAVKIRYTSIKRCIEKGTQLLFITHTQI